MSVVYKLTCVLYLSLSAFNSYAYSQQKVFISNIEASEDVNNRITSSEWSALNEELKIVIGRNIKSNTNKEYTLISAENISELLPPETRLEDCVGECIVKVGRLVQAHITVHGSLKWINKRYYLYLTATKTSSGEVLESERIAFKDFGEAFDKISKINLMHAAKSLEKNAQVTKRMKTLPESKPVNGNASYLLSNLRGGGSKRSSSSPILDLGASLGKKRPKKPSKSDITKAMRRVNVDRCAKYRADLDVKIYVKIQIVSNGSVRSAEALGPFKGTFIGKCLENEVRKQRVPPFRDSNISFRFPFKLRLENSSLEVKRSISLRSFSTDRVQDRDGDSILDTDDQCPRQPEDKDNFEDLDGCPDLDNDQDGILDFRDQCPLQPGPRSMEGCLDQKLSQDGDVNIDVYTQHSLKRLDASFPHTILVSSFRTLEEALALAQYIQAIPGLLAVPWIIKVDLKQKRKRYRVLVGKFESKSEASSVANQLKETTPNAMIRTWTHWKLGTQTRETQKTKSSFQPKKNNVTSLLMSLKKGRDKLIDSKSLDLSFSRPAKLSRGEILSTVRKNQRSINQCKAKLNAGDSRVRVTIRLKIEQSGSVRSVEFLSPSNYKRSILESCMKSRVQRFKFPAFSGPVMWIKLPFII